ncbi:MAG: Fic family protein [Deltaproteobacteria bacterium]|nr:Fic family protein [Deltaproteobacteria bacterium]
MTITTPPYALNSTILDLAERIGEAIGRAEDAAVRADLLLRRANRIRTIHGSLAIEGNTLTEEQVSTILEGKPVIAPLREIQEVRNAIKAYEQFPRWNPGREADLLNAHGVLMAGLLDAPGRYRRGGVGVMGPAEVHHIGPPADRVPHLMSNLLSWLDSTEEHPVIASSVFHYEFEFIHPFEDGNGRMGRLWQTLVLTRWKPLFAHVPVESLVHARQNEYYDAIRTSSAHGESTPFIIFMLEAILEAVRGFGATDQVSDQVSDQVTRLLAALRGGPKSATQLLAALGLSHRPTLRRNYIRPALDAGLVEMTRPESPTARNQQYRLRGVGGR